MAKPSRRRRVKSPSIRFSLLLLALLAICLFALFAIGLSSLVHRVFFPAQVFQEEAINVEYALKLLKGRPLYPDITQEGPYFRCTYPPLFPYLESLAMHFSRNIWIPGRILAFAFYWGCGLLMGFWGWRRWNNKWLTSSLVLILWLFPTWALWGSMGRLDTTVIFLNFGAFLILLGAETTNGKEKLFPYAWAGLLNAAALLVKPTASTLTAAFVICAFLGRRWKRLFLFLACALVPVVVFTGIAQWQTHGLYFKIVYRWVAINFDWDRLWFYLSDPFLKEAGWLMALAAWTLLLRRIPTLVKCQFIFGLLSLSSLARAAGAENYYMEVLLYGLFLTGEGWSESANSAWNQSILKKDSMQKIARSTAFLLTVLGVFSISRVSWPGVPSLQELEMKQSLVRLYGNGERHLALDMDLPLMAGKEIWYHSAGMMTLIEAGLWDPEPLSRDVREKKFTTIELYDIPRQYCLPARVVQEIRKNYHVAIRQYGRLWLVPN